MRLIPRFAKVGPWYVVVGYRTLLGAALGGGPALAVRTRRERRDRDLLARLDAVQVG